MKIIGLTGVIGAGKSFVADIFRAKGIPVFDADEEIHKLMEPEGEAVIPVAEQFPEALAAGMEINRKALGEIVFKNPDKLRDLEAILHPLLRRKGEEFIKNAENDGSNVIVQDIPLLFETGADKICDVTVVVSISKDTQRERVLLRQGMSENKLENIKKIQLSNKKKVEAADYVIDGEADKGEVEEIVEKIINGLSE